MTRIVKICGLSQAEHLAVANDASASHIGLVFHPHSPRNISIEKAARLAAVNRAFEKPSKLVALVADMDSSRLQEIVETIKPDVIQFHGSENTAALSQWRKDLPGAVELWKAIGIRTRADITIAAAMAPFCDRLLLDAKPPVDANYQGGHGRVFDWSVLERAELTKPWLLAGGLTPDNVVEAIGLVNEIGNFCGVDVSSGVEHAAGQKDPSLIATFIKRALQAMKAPNCS